VAHFLRLFLIGATKSPATWSRKTHFTSSHLVYRVYRKSAYNFVNSRISAILDPIKIFLGLFESPKSAIHIWYLEVIDENQPITGVRCKISSLPKNAEVKKRIFKQKGNY
jgi:hypothetical protein